MALGVSFPGMVSTPGITPTVRAAQVVGVGGATVPPPPTIPAPIFLTAVSIQHDGTPAIGEQLVGVDGVANYPVVSRRWLLGTTLLATTKTLTARAGTLAFENLTRGPDGREAVSRVELVVPGVSASLDSGPIGTNLDKPDDGSTEYPFLDRMKLSRPWQARGGGGGSVPTTSANFDADGWPTTLPSGAVAFQTTVPCHYPFEVVPTRRFVLLYDGTATFSFNHGTVISRAAGRIVVEHAPAGGADINILEISMRDFTGNPRPRIVREDQEALLAGGEVFAPRFLDCMGKMSLIRFMNWQRINGNPLVDWSERSRPSHASWAGAGGVPTEVIVALCNRVKRHAYVCVPATANDGFATAMLNLILSTLDATLLLYLELSNEIWNFQFPQTAYLDQKGKDLVGMGWGAFEYSGYRAAQIALIAHQLYAAAGMRHRLRNVWGMQTFAFAIMDAKERGATWAGSAQLPASGIRTLAEVFDCSAGTGYLNGDMFDSTTADDRAKILGWARSNDYTTALQQWRSGGHLTARNGTLEAVIAAIPSFVAWNNARGLESITYEDGSHMIVPPEFTGQEKDDVIAFMGRLHEQPGAGDIYRDAKAGIAAAGVTLQINYKFAGKPSVHGYWGALSYLDQADTPRWAALVAYQANPTAVVPAPLPLTVTASNPPATQGGKLPVVLTVKGGRGPYSAAVKSGALPAGRSLALLCERGTYTTTGVVPAYEIEVTDRLGSKASVTLNRTVLAQKANGLRFWELEVISTSFSERGFVGGGKVNEVTFRNADGSLDNLLAVVPYASAGFMYEHRAFDSQRNTVAEFPGLPESAKRLRFDLGEGEAGRPAQIGLNSEATQEWAAPLKFRVRATNDEAAWKAGTAPVVIDQSTNAHGGQNNPLGYPTDGTPKFFAVTYP